MGTGITPLNTFPRNVLSSVKTCCLAKRFCAYRDAPKHRVSHSRRFTRWYAGSCVRSAPDILVNTDSNFLKQQITSNLIEGQIQISPKAGAYFGYEYVHRVIADNFFNVQSAIYFPSTAARGNCALVAGVLPDGCTENPDGSISYVTPSPSFGPPGVTNINSNNAVLGFWMSSTPKWNLNVDAEIGSADNTFTNSSPRNYQQVRGRLKYRATSWMNVNLYAMATDGQNPVVTVNGSQHNINAGFALSLTPSEKYSIQLGYNYNDIYSSLVHLLHQQRCTTWLTRLPRSGGTSARTISLRQQDKYRIYRFDLGAS